MLPTLKRTITKSTLHVIEGTTYLCALCRHIAPGARVTSTLGYKLNAIPICGDNQGSIFMASNPVMEPHSKHINIHYHGIHKSVANGKVELFFINGAENPTDLLTKNLPHKKFAKFRGQLGL